MWTDRLQAQQDQQRDGGHASLDPLLQRHRAVMVVVDLLHHFLENLQEKRNTEEQILGFHLMESGTKAHKSKHFSFFFKFITVYCSKRLSYWFQLGHVPFQVLGHVHHLGDDVLQLLRRHQHTVITGAQTLCLPFACSAASHGEHE